MAKYSDEERKAWRERMNGLIKQVSALEPAQREEMARRMPIVTSEGHSLSPFNACFLSMQTELPLTIIAGFRQWQSAGRQVFPGQKAAGYIYVPMKRKKDGRDITEEKLRFRLVPVFDIAQTEESVAAAA